MPSTFNPIQPFFVVNTNRYYKKLAPNSPFVHFYSFNVDAGDPTNSAALPNGCVDLLFNYTDTNAEGYLCGFVTKIDSLKFPRGSRCFGVRFKPGYLPERLGVSLPDTLGEHLSLSDLPGGVELLERVSEINDLANLKDLVNNFIGGRWRSHDLLLQFIAEVEECGGLVRIDELEKRTLYSSRYINRVFNDNMGLSPKAFTKYVRFQQLINEMNKPVRPCLADLAIQSGYYDQPHFSKEFKDLTTLTPLEYLGVVD
ncbi:MAG: helix-turn-helix domain-containing protein, partial [Deltaproteobacteria bacterium]|nr:helix-turn-helix domain-containing protein [Deltaproteobacteria bacterium]